MKILLDTCVILWSQTSPEEINKKGTQLLSDRRNELFVSAISTLEIAQLVFKKRVHLNKSVEKWMNSLIDTLTAESVAVSNEIAAESYLLGEQFHGDPADRILIATARLKDLTILTADRKILDYPLVRSIDTRK
jgi:PIN domain nuclease of toxin-antitoxin system